MSGPINNQGKEGFVRAIRQGLESDGQALPEERVFLFDDPHGFMSPPDPYIDARRRVEQALSQGF